LAIELDLTEIDLISEYCGWDWFLSCFRAHRKFGQIENNGVIVLKKLFVSFIRLKKWRPTQTFDSDWNFSELTNLSESIAFS
jgi:hypothetical protein